MRRMRANVIKSTIAGLLLVCLMVVLPTTTITEEEPQIPVASEKKVINRKVVAYYFHGNMRCMTCRTIEAYAKEAIQAKQTELEQAQRRGDLETAARIQYGELAELKQQAEAADQRLAELHAAGGNGGPLAKRFWRM